MTSAKRLISSVTVISIILSIPPILTGCAKDSPKAEHVSLFEPQRKKSKPFVSKALAAAIDKNKVAPAIIILRPPSEIASSRIEFRRLQAQVDQIQRGVLAELDENDFRLIHKYDFVPGFSGQLSQRGLDKLVRHRDVLGIDFDHQGVGHLAESLPLIGANEWHANGVTGDGALVAVLDTGVANHEDLDDDVLLELCILKSNTNEGGIPCPDGSDEQLFEEGAALDGQGHGTNVTGIITSAGTIAPLGVAPDANIVAIKVLDDQNPSGTGQISDWIKGLEWVLTIHPAVDGQFNVRVVNMSLGIVNNGFVGNGDCELPGTSGQLMADAVNILRQVGVLTIASSGNDSFSNGIAFPSCISTILSVGATDDDDQMKFFSNSNANLDVLAPGDFITSTGITGILTQSGTSQASPHVAACAALRVQDNPTLTPDQLQTILTNSPVFVANPNSGLSFPRLWCKPPEQM